MDFFKKLTIVTFLGSEHECILDGIYSPVDVFVFQRKASSPHHGLAGSCPLSHTVQDLQSHHSRLLWLS